MRWTKNCSGSASIALTVVGVAIPGWLAFGQAGPLVDADPAVATITEREIRSSMEALTAPEMAGRGNGQEGLRVAAEYLAGRFEEIGLQPLEGTRGYLQPFAWLRTESGLRSTGSLTLSREGASSIRFEDGGIFLYNDDPVDGSILAASGVAEGEVVFAGYGISGLEYDDYTGVDVRGRIALVLRGSPRYLDPANPMPKPSPEARLSGKILNAQAHGAIGVIVLTDPKYDALAREVREPWRGWTFGQPPFLDPVMEDISIPCVYAEHAMTEALLGPTDLEALREEMDASGQPSSFLLPGLSARLESTVVRETATLANVVGVVPGTDPELSDQVVVVGAHYDHDGIRKGKVYPGADDNASGTAAVLEIAEAFRMSGVAPSRTVVFVAFAAEEPKGGLGDLAGSSFFMKTMQGLPFRVVAAVNLDMVGRNRDERGFLRNLFSRERPNELYVSGPGYAPGLKDVTVAANQGVELDLRFDGWGYANSPEFMASGDQRTFFQDGVPVVSLFDQMGSDLHHTGDTPDRIDYGKVRNAATLAYRLARILSGPAPIPEVDWGAWRRIYVNDLYGDSRY